MRPKAHRSTRVAGGETRGVGTNAFVTRCKVHAHVYFLGCVAIQTNTSFCGIYDEKKQKVTEDGASTAILKQKRVAPGLPYKSDQLYSTRGEEVDQIRRWSLILTKTNHPADLIRLPNLLQAAEGLVRLHRQRMSRHDSLVLAVSHGHKPATAAYRHHDHHHHGHRVRENTMPCVGTEYVPSRK